MAVDILKVFADFRGNDVDLQDTYMGKVLVFDAKMVSNKDDYATIKIKDSYNCIIEVDFKSGTLTGFDLSKTYKITAKIKDFAEDSVSRRCRLPMQGISIEPIN